MASFGRLALAAALAASGTYGVSLKADLSLTASAAAKARAKAKARAEFRAEQKAALISRYQYGLGILHIFTYCINFNGIYSVLSKEPTKN